MIRKLNQSLIWPVVVLIVVFGAFLFKPWQTKPQETISVQSSGEAQVTPNIAKISASIKSENKDLDKAREENERKIEKSVARLKDLGVWEKDIKTQHISAGQTYELQIFPPRRVPTNQFTTTLEITVRNFESADEVIATLTQNGAADLYGPNLTVSEESLESAKTQAREKAVDSARQKAEELAKLSRRKLGKVVTIKEQGDFQVPPPIIAYSEADLRQKASLIQPGQNEVSISLQVDFSLR